jgi:hypothetical protein
MTTKLSPSKLKPSLLIVLGGLVATPADHTQLDDMVTAFCDHHSIEEDAWGYMTSQKNPRSWVRYNITKAFTKLREEGLGEAKGRGKYGLTAEGITKAKGNAPASKVEWQEDTVVEVRVTKPVANPTNFEEGDGVSWTIGDIPEDTYHNDESIKEIAISQTSCFGYWAERSPTCKACPLAGSCKRTAFLAFLEIAEGLDAEDAKRKEEAKAQAESKEEEPEKVEESWEDLVEVEAPKSSAVIDPATVMEAPCDLECDKCGKTIKMGSKAIWDVENSKNPIHYECA